MIFNEFEENVVGNSGNIKIKIGVFLVKNGLEISILIFGEGNVGNVIIEVSDVVVLDWEDLEVIIIVVS